MSWMQSLNLRVWRNGLLLAVGGFILSASADAASVYNCSASGAKCVMKVEDGIIGDRVKVMDEKARVIASGRITKRRGGYAMVAIVRKSQAIRKGYPVIVDVENRSSNELWAASFSQ